LCTPTWAPASPLACLRERPPCLPQAPSRLTPAHPTLRRPLPYRPRAPRPRAWRPASSVDTPPSLLCPQGYYPLLQGLIPPLQVTPFEPPVPVAALFVPVGWGHELRDIVHSHQQAPPGGGAQIPPGTRTIAVDLGRNNMWSAVEGGYDENDGVWTGETSRYGAQCRPPFLTRPATARACCWGRPVISAPGHPLPPPAVTPGAATGTKSAPRSASSAASVGAPTSGRRMSSSRRTTAG